MVLTKLVYTKYKVVMSSTNKPTPSYSQLYLSLRDQVATENAIFSSKGDLYSTALTLTLANAFSKKYLKESTKKLKQELEAMLTKRRSLSHFKDSCLVHYLIKTTGTSESKIIKEFLEANFEQVSSSNISPQILGTANYFLKDVSNSLTNYDKLQSSLVSRLEEYIKSQNVNASLDIAMGIAAIPESTQSKLEQLIAAKNSGLDFERIAKTSILTQREDAVLTLEDHIIENIREWSQPDVNLSIIEAQKIINSNMPADTLDDVLERLKVSDTKWSKIISDIQANGVTIDISQLQRIPNFSINQDVWAVIALEKAGRDITYQIPEVDYKGYLDYSSRTKTGFYSIKMMSVWWLVILTTALTLYTVAVFAFNYVNLPETYKNISFENNVLNYDSKYFILTNPWLVTLSNLLWTVILLIRLRSRGVLQLMDFIVSWPVLFAFKSVGDWWKNMKHSKNDK